MSQLDLVFPGLGDCFKDVLRAKGGHTILRHCPDPVRIARMGPEGLRALMKHRGVRMARSKASLIVATAQRALLVPNAERRARMRVLQADLAIYDKICAEIDRAEAELATVIDDTPAAVLTSLPGVGIARASAYGAALGDPWRFASADTAWRYSGLVPVEHNSAGTKRPGMRISREGSIALREAIVEIGKGLSDHHPEFKAYKRPQDRIGEEEDRRRSGSGAPRSPVGVRHDAHPNPLRPRQVAPVNSGRVRHGRRRRPTRRNPSTNPHHDRSRLTTQDRAPPSGATRMGDRTRTDVALVLRPTHGADLADNKTPGPARPYRTRT